VKDGGGVLEHCRSSTREISHGYSSGRKVDFLKIPGIFWRLAGTYCLGMTIFIKKILISLVHLFFHKNPLYESHWNSFGTWPPKLKKMLS